MPNHVTHRMVLTGPAEALAAFMANHVRVPAGSNASDDAPSLDFASVIPIPDIIRQTESSSTVSDGLALLGRDDVGERFFRGDQLHIIMGYPWMQKTLIEARAADLDAKIKAGEDPKAVLAEAIPLPLEPQHYTADDYEVCARYLLERSPDCLDKARLAIRAKEETGHSSWYDWNVANWGTKWNSYSLVVEQESADRIELTFQTAWSTPEPVLEKLAAANPQLAFTVDAFDEGWNFAYQGRAASGLYVGTDVPATPELYEKVYGEPAPSDDDDDGDGDSVTPPATVPA